MKPIFLFSFVVHWRLTSFRQQIATKKIIKRNGITGMTTDIFLNELRKRKNILTLLVSVSFFLSTISGAMAQLNAHQPILFLPDVLIPSGRFTLLPGFTPDGQTMFYSQTDCLPIWKCPQYLKRIDKTSEGWTLPRALLLPRAGRSEAPSVTPDGRYLLFSWATTRPEYPNIAVDENFDLWRLDLTNANAVPELLQGPDLNTLRTGQVKTLRYVNNETAPILTKDGDLFFWSERLDGMGERDIYLARASPDGGFQKPEPLPSPINSSGRDDGSWVSADGKLMLINYSDRGGCGGKDLFLSKKLDGVWTDPKNLGCKINSTYDDGAGMMIPGTNTLVFASSRPFEGAKGGTIALWSVELQVE